MHSLELRDITVAFTVGEQRRRRQLTAVDQVSLDLAAGVSLGLVGESGCGKSTLANVIVGLQRPTAGAVLVDGRDVSTLSRPELRDLRRSIQVVMQDPFASLNPRQRVREIIAEPLLDRRLERGRRHRRRVEEMLEVVGLPSSAAERYPHQFSGGQRQRIAIARALASEPDLVVLDEATSGLDVSVRAQILNMLRDLQDELGVSYLFISHDLASVGYLCDRIAVMYLGRIVELGGPSVVQGMPNAHPYTELLARSVPQWSRPLEIVEAEGRSDVPSALSRPSGCAFHPRCPLRGLMADARVCVEEVPALTISEEGRQVACHFPGLTTRPAGSGPAGLADAPVAG